MRRFMKSFSKKNERKPERLTAAQARAIPIEGSLIKNILEEIYGKIRKAAALGETETHCSFSLASDRIREEIIRQLKDDGYYIKFTGFSWEISWREG